MAKMQGAGALAKSIAATVLEKVLILLHPVMPFITEELWHKLPQTSGSIMKATFPEAETLRIDPEAEEQMETLMADNSRNPQYPRRNERLSGTQSGGGVPMRARFGAGLITEQERTVADLAKVSRLTVARAGESINRDTRRGRW